MVFFSKDCVMLCLNQVQKTERTLLDNGPSNTAAEKQDRRKRNHKNGNCPDTRRHQLICYKSAET